MSIITQVCLECKENFETRTQDIKRGYGKYCSRICCNKNISKKYKEKNLLKNQPNVECSYCHKMFYKNNSKKKLSKSGLYFCCREHKDESQKIGGIIEIQPPHYRGAPSIYNYRKIAFENYPHKCQKCEYNKIPEILEVHHKDRNRENNSIENLIILCSRCHDEEHYLTRTGKWCENK